MTLTCKYCGKENPNFSISCSKSPTKKHVLVPTGSHCVYCGKEKPNMSISCSYSPTKKHQLAE